MDYYSKYLKYKKKYIYLQKGASLITAKNLFIKNLTKNPKLFDIIRNDTFLCSKLENINEYNYNDLFDTIYKNFINFDDNIDWIIYSYLNNTFGEPSSFENIGRYKQAYKDYKKLKSNYPETPYINDIKGLINLEKYINENSEKLAEIDSKRSDKIKKRMEEKKKKELGEDDYELILETDNIYIYKPTTVNGACYYGSNTRWCTAGREDNMFDYYNDQGPIFIIQSKLKPHVKYQIHKTTNYKISIMDSKDSPVTIDGIVKEINDPILKKYLEDFFEIKNEFVSESNNCKIILKAKTLLGFNYILKEFPRIDFETDNLNYLYQLKSRDDTNNYFLLMYNDNSIFLHNNNSRINIEFLESDDVNYDVFQCLVELFNIKSTCECNAFAANGSSFACPGTNFMETNNVIVNKRTIKDYTYYLIKIKNTQDVKKLLLKSNGLLYNEDYERVNFDMFERWPFYILIKNDDVFYPFFTKITGIEDKILFKYSYGTVALKSSTIKGCNYYIGTLCNLGDLQSKPATFDNKNFDRLYSIKIDYDEYRLYVCSDNSIYPLLQRRNGNMHTYDEIYFGNFIRYIKSNRQCIKLFEWLSKFVNTNNKIIIHNDNIKLSQLSKLAQSFYNTATNGYIIEYNKDIYIVSYKDVKNITILKNDTIISKDDLYKELKDSELNQWLIKSIN